MKKLILAVIVLTFCASAFASTPYDVGFAVPDVFSIDDTVTISVAIGSAAPVATTVPVNTLRHYNHSAEGAQSFPAIEYRRVFTNAEFNAGVKVTLTNQAGKVSAARGITVYAWGSP